MYASAAYYSVSVLSLVQPSSCALTVKHLVFNVI